MEKRPVYDHHHAVQFYGDDTSLFTTVAGFLSQGFVDGHPAIVIATKTIERRFSTIFEGASSMWIKRSK